MGKSTYTRKTDNPKMAWSEERRAKYSAQCKEAHANGTRYKQSKKAVSRAISNGLKEAVKRRNRSEAMKKSWKKRQAQKAEPVDFFSSPEIKKRLDERDGGVRQSAMSENLLDKAVLPEVPEGKINALDVISGFEEEEREAEAKEGHTFPEPYESWDKKQTDEFAAHLAMAHSLLYNIDLLFGIKPTLHSFLIAAIKEKFDRVTETFRTAPDPSKRTCPEEDE